jgi:hypothetical protein
LDEADPDVKRASKELDVHATYNATKNAAFITFSLPITSKKLLMTEIVEQAMKRVYIR